MSANSTTRASSEDEVSASSPKWGARLARGSRATTVLVMGLRDVERAIERGVDGVLGRVFRAEVTPLEIEKRVERELEAGARSDRDGGRTMPNEIEVRIHTSDAAALSDSTDTIEKALLAKARDCLLYTSPSPRDRG